LELALYFLRGALYLEIGKTVDAATLADEFLATRPLRPNASKHYQANPTVYMHALRFQAGKLSQTEYLRLRTEWIAKQAADTTFDRAVVWLAAYAIPAFSPDLAKEAVDNLPEPWNEIAPVGAKFSKPFTSFRGRVLALAGKYTDAIPYLENAVGICTSTEPTLWHTQNLALLGNAREATGDKPGACKAYEWVLTHWGKSKQSVTVKEVIKRAKKLECESTAGQ
jgi:tetratricopeptide (TPR) repeat protein